ncbi:DEKNAAC103728 [Brettanomyces naardenensis]|uniref:DEKNAAC103728 n=1 Tax=Brettanomyces naardenensis TaxID=13370 RepID=A0A448YP49_BRENA|nr:DEKNAAC103728 [Brettanomyces naardenensis]
MTIATAFAETTRFSTTNAEMRLRTLNLYRRYIRHAKQFVNNYDLDVSPAQVKTKIRQEFEKRRYVNDLAVENVMYMKAQMEFQELVNFWKQKCHVMKYFESYESYDNSAKDSFVEKFLKGAD